MKNGDFFRFYEIKMKAKRWECENFAKKTNLPLQTLRGFCIIPPLEATNVVRREKKN